MRRRASPQSDLAACAEGVSPAELFAPPRPGRTTQALEELERLDPALLQRRWRSVIGRPAPDSLSRQLKIRILVFREQVARGGDIDAGTRCALAAALRDSDEGPRVSGSRIGSATGLSPRARARRRLASRRGSGPRLRLEWPGFCEPLRRGARDLGNQLERPTLLRPRRESQGRSREASESGSREARLA